MFCDYFFYIWADFVISRSSFTRIVTRIQIIAGLWLLFLFRVIGHLADQHQLEDHESYGIWDYDCFFAVGVFGAVTKAPAQALVCLGHAVMTWRWLDELYAESHRCVQAESRFPVTVAKESE